MESDQNITGGGLSTRIDDEVLLQLLFNITHNDPVSSGIVMDATRIVMDVVLYLKHPSELRGLAFHDKGDTWAIYFLSLLEKQGMQVRRRYLLGQNGHWKPIRQREPISTTSSNSAVIHGTKTYMKYLDKNEARNHWFMTEYRLVDNGGSNPELVLCMVRYKGHNNFENHSGARDIQYHQPTTHNLASSSMMQEGSPNMGESAPTLGEDFQISSDLNWSDESLNQFLNN